jgi:hypothetical protein
VGVPLGTLGSVALLMVAAMLLAGPAGARAEALFAHHEPGPRTTQTTHRAVQAAERHAEFQTRRQELRPIPYLATLTPADRTWQPSADRSSAGAGANPRHPLRPALHNLPPPAAG